MRILPVSVVIDVRTFCLLVLLSIHVNINSSALGAHIQHQGAHPAAPRENTSIPWSCRLQGHTLHLQGARTFVTWGTPVSLKGTLCSCMGHTPQLQELHPPVPTGPSCSSAFLERTLQLQDARPANPGSYHVAPGVHTSVPGGTPCSFRGCILQLQGNTLQMHRHTQQL